jgi:AcrR family transcriptional regulator
MRKAQQALVGLRERKKTQTREAIVNAALDLFERNGYDATTVEEIAEAADVSPRTFFRYFDTKLDTVMTHKDAGQDTDFGELLWARPPDEGPIEATRHVMQESMVEMLTENPTHVRQTRIMLATPSLPASAREHFNEHEAELARGFARRLDLPDDALQAHVMAAMVGNAIWTVATRWVAEDTPPERLSAMLDEALDLLARGLDAAPPPSPPG